MYIPWPSDLNKLYMSRRRLLKEGYHQVNSARESSPSQLGIHTSTCAGSITPSAITAFLNTFAIHEVVSRKTINALEPGTLDGVRPVVGIVRLGTGDVLNGIRACEAATWTSCCRLVGRRRSVPFPASISKCNWSLTVTIFLIWDPNTRPSLGPSLGIENCLVRATSVGHRSQGVIG